MFSIDIYNNPEPLSIFLSQPSGNIISCIDEFINTDDARLTVGLNQQLELNFSVTIALDNILPFYESLQEGMYLFVEKFGLFKMKQPTIESDGSKETKIVTALSCDCELEDKNCTLALNMGTKESQEYLVKYDDDETESLLNPYTNIPYDWLVLYNTFPEQLEIVKNKYNSGYYGNKDSSGNIVVTNKTIIEELEKLFNLIPRLKNKVIENNGDYSVIEYIKFTYDLTGEKITTITLLSNFLGRVNTLITFYTKYRKQLSLLCVVLDETGGSWEVGEIYGIANGDYSLANRKYQFQSDETIYSFLTHTLSETAECIVSFNLINRKVNLTPVSQIGNDTGINFDYDNLISMLNISSNDEQLTTRLTVTGLNDLSIEQVNFGLPYIDDITYKLNARDNNGKRIYVSDELAEKYMKFIDYRESLRQQYIQYSKDYSSYGEQISDIQYRVPNDSLKTDWGTFTYDELEAALTTYKNLLAALITLYKEDYGTAGMNADGSVKESFIKNTMYWYDYEAYKNTIVEIECACHTYPYYSDQTKWTKEDIAQYKNAIKAWETDWTLYGTIELQAKIDAYTADMKILAEQSVILVSENVDEIKTWSQLTTDEKEKFGNAESNYFYDEYMTYYNYRKSAKTYLATLQSQINTLQSKQNNCQTNRLAIVKNVTISNYFTKEECKQIYLLFRDASYSNENILTTSIDNSSKSIDTMYELLNDGKDKLSALCRPQLTFSVQSDNLLGLVEFKPLWKQFIPGNYILVKYRDNTYIKLRLVGYQFNPLLPSSRDFTMTFSNFIRSRVKVSDLEDLLGLSASSGTNGSSGGSGSGSGGTYGESDDIDVTISNTMLAKLLNSEMFGTRVSNIILDTVDANSITAKFAKFEGLAKGTTTIDGKCITTGYIIDQSYNGKSGDIDNTSGSVINLETGKFSFAGGKLKWDNTTLSIKGSITADSGYIGGESGFVIASGKLYSNGHSAYNTDKDGVYIGTDYISLGKKGETYFKSDGTGKIGSWNINANSIYRGSSTYGASGGMYFGTSGISISDKFKVDSNGNLSITDAFSVDKDGKLTATQATITGNITANKLTATSEGKIACWNITSTSIWYGNSAWGKAGGIYFGTSGLSLSNKFTVTASGNVNIGDKIKYDGSTLTISSDVVLNWSNLPSNVAAEDDIPTKTSELTNDSDFKTGSQVTQITKDTVTTSYVNALKITANSVAAENITGTTISGKTLSGGSITIGSNFSVNTSGVLTAKSASITGSINATTMKAQKAYYLVDSDFSQAVKVVSYSPDNTSDTKFNFGRLTQNGYSSSLNYISFIDQSEYRQCHIYSGYLWVHGAIHASSHIRAGTNCSFHVETKGDGLTSDACGWLIRFADNSNHNNMIMIGNSTYTSSVYGNGHIWKNGSATTYLSTASTSSDKRLKDYVSDLSEFEDFFMDLSPIGYTYHDGLYNVGDTKPLIKWGFYAQDIIKSFESKGMEWDKYDLVIKEMTDISSEERKYIDDTCDGILKVSYENFTALNTYMLQKAYKKIAELERKVEELSK